MLKFKPEKIVIPSRIITTKKAPVGVNKKGIIYDNYEGVESVFQILLDEPHEAAHTLKGLLSTKKGIFLKRDEFAILPIKKEIDKFRLIMEHRHYTDIFVHTKRKIEDCQYQIKSAEDNIKYQEADIVNRKKQIVKQNKLLESLKANLEGKMDNFDNQYEKMIKHPKIKGVYVVNDLIIVTTKDLIFHDSRKRIPNFELGAYHIFIPKDVLDRNYIKIINYKKHYRYGAVFHPCVDTGGRVCTGNQLASEVNRYLADGQIALAVFSYIDFLEHPNYGTPYLTADKFRAAQIVTWKPKSVLTYLKPAEWSKNEKWDEKKCLQDTIKAYEEDIRREESRDNKDFEYINQLNHWMSSFKSSLASYENNH